MRFKANDVVFINKLAKKETLDKYNRFLYVGGLYYFHSYFNTPYIAPNGVYVDCMIGDFNGTYPFNSKFITQEKDNYGNFYSVYISTDNNVVTAKMIDIYNSKYYEGKASCHNDDKFNIHTGTLLAIARMFDDEELEKYILKRSEING